MLCMSVGIKLGLLANFSYICVERNLKDIKGESKLWMAESVDMSIWTLHPRWWREMVTVYFDLCNLF